LISAENSRGWRPEIFAAKHRWLHSWASCPVNSRMSPTWH